MSNKTVNYENRINKNKPIQNKKSSIDKNATMNSLLQRIADGHVGVVLEELLWEITVERRSGLNWESVNQILKNLINLHKYFVKGCQLATLFRHYATVDLTYRA